MADEKVTAGFQAGGQAAGGFLLRLGVEVDHDVAAEDHRKLARERNLLHKIEPGELSLSADGGPHPKSVRAGIPHEVTG